MSCIWWHWDLHSRKMIEEGTRWIGFIIRDFSSRFLENSETFYLRIRLACSKTLRAELESWVRNEALFLHVKLWSTKYEIIEFGDLFFTSQTHFFQKFKCRFCILSNKRILFFTSKTQVDKPRNYRSITFVDIQSPLKHVIYVKDQRIAKIISFTLSTYPISYIIRLCIVLVSNQNLWPIGNECWEIGNLCIVILYIYMSTEELIFQHSRCFPAGVRYYETWSKLWNYVFIIN